MPAPDSETSARWEAFYKTFEGRPPSPLLCRALALNLPGMDHPQAIDLPGVCRVAVAHRQTQGVAALVFEPSDCGALAQPTGRLFVFGDSHAMHFHAMYDGLARLHGLQTHGFGTGGCAYLGLRPAAPACAEGTERALAQLQRELRAGDVLMLSSLRVRRMVDHWAHFHAPEGVVAEMTAAAFVADRDREIREAVPVLKALHASGELQGEPGLARMMLFGALNWSVQWYDPGRKATLDDLTQTALLLFLKDPV